MQPYRSSLRISVTKRSFQFNFSKSVPGCEFAESGLNVKVRQIFMPAGRINIKGNPVNAKEFRIANPLGGIFYF